MESGDHPSPVTDIINGPHLDHAQIQRLRKDGLNICHNSQVGFGGYTKFDQEPETKVRIIWESAPSQPAIEGEVVQEPGMRALAQKIERSKAAGLQGPRRPRGRYSIGATPAVTNAVDV